MRIEIIAPLAAGKSTLVDYIARHGVEVVTEKLSDNPYLELRKIDPAKYTVPCQEKFINDKMVSLSDAIKNNGHNDMIADFSVWTERAYARHLIPTYVNELADMSRRVDAFYDEHGVPDVLVFMSISVEEQMKRVKHRGRSFEQVYTYDYLKALNTQIENEASLAILTGVKTVIFNSDEMTTELMSEILKDEINLLKGPRVAA